MLVLSHKNLLSLIHSNKVAIVIGRSRFSLPSTESVIFLAEALLPLVFIRILNLENTHRPRTGPLSWSFLRVVVLAGGIP